MDKVKKRMTIRLFFAIPFLCVSLVLITILLFTRMFLSGTSLQAIFVAALSLLALALIAGIVLAKAILGPLHILKQTAEAVTKGNLAQKLNFPTQDEVGSLSEVFDNLINTFNKYLKESLEAAVVVINSNGEITSANSKVKEIFGREAIQGTHYKNLFEAIPEVLSVIEKSLKEKRPLSSQKVRCNGNQVFSVSVTVFKEDLEKEPGIIVFLREAAQLDNFRRQLVQADSLVYLGTLTAGLAHEFRNPLAALQGLIELIETNFNNPKKCEQYLEKMNEVITRLNSMVSDMLAYAHADPESFKAIDLNLLIKNTLTIVAYEFNMDKIRLTKELHPEPLMTLGDETKLFQVFNNLIRNAFQATSQEGEVRVATKKMGNKAVVEITNTGSYIPPEKHTEIFVPFYTTKRKGTGLGLPIAKRIIEAHHGRIGLKSLPEKITTFIVELPLEK